MNLKSFFIKVIVSTVMLLVVIFIISKPEGTNEQAKHFFNVTFRENIQFSKINELIEKNYGTISAFLPTELQGSEEDYAPASGNVGLLYEKVNGGFIVTTDNGRVMSLAEGVVTFVGESEQGEMEVGIQLDDGSTVLYSGLVSANVRTYQHVQSGELLGTTAPSGEYFLKAPSSQGLLD